MSTDYYLVCDKHEESVMYGSYSGTNGHMLYADSKVSEFFEKHKDCEPVLESGSI